MTHNKALQNQSAEEYWKKEKCECPTCKDLGIEYDYPPRDTHQETNWAHSAFDIMDYEKGVAPI